MSSTNMGQISLFDIIKSLFKSPIFLFVLVIKLLFSFFFISDIPGKLFIPFLSYFGANPLLNPYQFFFDQGILNAFPYPSVMLFIVGLPFFIFSSINSIVTLSNLDLILLKFPLLVADIIILSILTYFNQKRKMIVLLLYWLSPIILYVTYIHGQLDIIPIMFLMLSLYFLVKQKFFLSSLNLALALASKSHILIAIPFYLFYFLKKRYEFSKIILYFGSFLVLYVLFLLPYIFSKGFIQLVFFVKEQLRLFDLSFVFQDGVSFYIVIAVYLYLVFKAFSMRKLTKDLLFVFIGITFMIFVTLVKPSIGWYLWSVPFLVYFLSKSNKLYSYIYIVYSFIYLIYIALIPNSDIFNVFQLLSPTIASFQTPYNYFISYFPQISIILSIVFTFLSSSLIYLSYLMYRYGINSSAKFQKEKGIPTIGISGDSGSGKTTLSNLLANIFGEKNVSVIHGDDIHKWERGDEKWSKYTHLNPISNRLHNHYTQILKLKKGEGIYRSQYNHQTGKFTKALQIKPKSYIIDEGLHTFLIDGKALHDLKVYIEPDAKLNRYWKIERDISKRGHDIEKVLKTIESRKADREKYLLPQKDYADIIVSILPHERAVSTIDFKNTSKYKVMFILKSEINIDPFLEVIQKLTKLNVEFEYIDPKHQKIIIEGHFIPKMAREILRELEIDYNEHEISLKGFKSGINGIIQLLIFYSLDEKLKRNFEFENGLYG